MSFIGRNWLKRSEAADKVNVQAGVAEEVVGLVRVDDEQSGAPERVLRLAITNSLKRNEVLR